jgi:hypothetical protein
MKKKLKKICGNCLLYDKEQGQCRVAILINGEQIHMPVSPNDKCHMDELGIPVEQVRWWVEDPHTGKPTTGSGTVKIEYPKGFFGEDKKR